MTVGDLLSIISKNCEYGIESYFHHLDEPDELKLDLRRQFLDIILISETWLNVWHMDGMLSIHGHKLLRTSLEYMHELSTSTPTC